MIALQNEVNNAQPGLSSASILSDLASCDAEKYTTLLGLRYQWLLKQEVDTFVDQCVLIWGAQRQFGIRKDRFRRWLSKYVQNVDHKTADRRGQMIEQMTGGDAKKIESLKFIFRMPEAKDVLTLAKAQALSSAPKYKEKHLRSLEEGIDRLGDAGVVVLGRAYQASVLHERCQKTS